MTRIRVGVCALEYGCQVFTGPRCLQHANPFVELIQTTHSPRCREDASISSADSRLPGGNDRTYTSVSPDAASVPRERTPRPLIMRRSRIFAMLLTFALSLQLVLAGDGESCVGVSLDGGRAGMTMSQSAMREMGMSSPVAHEASRDGNSLPSQNQVPPCDRSPASTSCQLFASCAAGFVVAESSEGPRQQKRPTSPRLTETPSLSSRTSAPELPPPRA